MIDSLTNLETKEINNNDMVKKGFNITIQFLVESYLKSKGEESINSILKSKNIKNVPGKIYNYHIAILQIMLNEELLNFGYDLAKEVEKSGEKFKLGELSKLEEKVIFNKVLVGTCLLSYSKKTFLKDDTHGVS